MKTLEEKNRMIAEFMGMTPHSNEEYPIIYKSLTDDEWFTPCELLFHTSWEWLMPVVEKMRDMKGLTIPKTLDWLSDWLMQPVETREQIYQAVVEFIEWYNENK